MPEIAALRRAALAELRPVELLPLSAWLPRTLRLPGGLAASPGPIRLWKFQQGIADAMTDPAIERVTVQKGARLGYSTLLVGAIAYFARAEPSSVLCVLPTDDDARNFVVSQLEAGDRRLAGAGRRHRRLRARSTDARAGKYPAVSAVSWRHTARRLCPVTAQPPGALRSHPGRRRG